MPIDIQSITASLVFDGAAHAATGDATVDFVCGLEDGCPVLDLRQTVTGLWLDGNPVPLSQLAHHDFGGGLDAELLVLATTLAAGSHHTLRLVYSLGPPQASGAGSYLPNLHWDAGPRLSFNFGFTDLGAGRYLEAWIPANLIYDQFTLTLSLRVSNTAVPHQLITNGAVTTIGANHWSVTYPSRFTALSPLLELRAADTLTSATGTVTLPVSGAAVTIEAWKLQSNTANLATAVANLKTWLADNENQVGPYLHGNRFVAFVNVGGMEYEGGTTSGPGALRHETFHSWWARGVKPASQPDAWWDEAWTTFNVDTSPVATPFDFSAAPVELCPRNPWIRVTASGSYGLGDRLFEGLAALLGVPVLEAHMKDFYARSRGTVVTTQMIEEFLLFRSGHPLVVDAFHRFVYGFPDAAPGPDLWIRDALGDPGPDAWAGAFWNSPDLWIRNRDDGGTTHQPPEYGQDNWFHARVRNRGAGTARHFAVTFNVKSFAGTEFTYPTDFLPCIAAATGFDLAAGQSTVVKARWPKAFVPAPGTHACWLAAVLARNDRPVDGRHVWEHNNLAQKNLTIVDLKPDQWFVLPFVLGNLRLGVSRRYLVELRRSTAAAGVQAFLVHQNARGFESPDKRLVAAALREAAGDHDTTPTALDCGGGAGGDIAGRFAPGAGDVLTSASAGNPRLGAIAKGVEMPFGPGAASSIPIVLRARQQIVPALRLHVPATAVPGQVLTFDLAQRDAVNRRVVGGIAVEIRVR